MNTIRWGILGPGTIAKQFARGLAALNDHHLVAAGSRDVARAQAFLDEFAPKAQAHGSYEALVNDPNIDAIYVATPHTSHREHAELALRAGKAVLCEKPLCVNLPQAQALVAAAKDSGSFLMEAMWTRFLPALEQAMEQVRSGVIGEPRMLTCDFGFRCGWNPEGRLLNPALAGGGLLDVGIYTVAMASLVFGHTPSSINAQAHIGESGVDEQAAIMLGYDSGQLAVLTSAVRTNTPHSARIDGTEGRITIPSFWRATSYTIERAGSDVETIQAPHGANGYEYEAAEVGRCLRQGVTESPRLTHAESLGIMAIMDQARAAVGLHYPCDPT
jgi:dihydrodiol dehydrogenase / D-xylose 1-dehydrogenase (NADP)